MIEIGTRIRFSPKKILTKNVSTKDVVSVVTRIWRDYYNNLLVSFWINDDRIGERLVCIYEEDVTVW